MPALMSQKDYAAHRGVRPSAVSNWKKANLLVFAADPADPTRQLVDVEKSDLVVGGKIDQTRGRPRAADQARVEAAGEGSAPVVVAASSRGMSALENARLAEMEERLRSRRIDNDARLGQLVPVAEYERQAGEFGRKCREGVHAIVRQQAERLAAESEPRQIIAVLGEAFDKLFARLADDVEAEAHQEREVDQQLAPLADDDDAEDLEP